MKVNELKELAIDTLFGTRIGPRGSCFKTNEAGIDLAAKGPEALPIIEELLESVVLPNLPLLNTTDDAGMVGLKYLIGSYLVIGVRANNDRVFEFIRRQPLVLQMEAIGCSSTFFWKPGDSYNFGVTPNEGLLRFLETYVNSDDDEVASLSAKVKMQITNSLTERL